MTASPSKADADAERFVLDEPPADMGREGAYDAQEAREEKADAAAGGKFLVLEFWPTTYRGCSRTASEVPMELYLLVASGLYCAWQMVDALDFVGRFTTVWFHQEDNEFNSILTYLCARLLLCAHYTTITGSRPPPPPQDRHHHRKR